jgi:hypothetical protein
MAAIIGNGSLTMLQMNYGEIVYILTGIMIPAIAITTIKIPFYSL